jgi:hypothetical protein
MCAMRDLVKVRCKAGRFHLMSFLSPFGEYSATSRVRGLYQFEDIVGLALRQHDHLKMNALLFLEVCIVENVAVTHLLKTGTHLIVACRAVTEDTELLHMSRSVESR